MTERDSSRPDRPRVDEDDGWPPWLCATVETVHSVLDETESAPELGTTLPAAISANTPVSFACVTTLDEETVRVRSSSAEVPARLDVKSPDQTLTAQAESTGDLQRVTDRPPEDVRLLAEHIESDLDSAAAVVAVPLCAEGTSYGALHLWTPESSEPVGVLTSLGRRVGRRLHALECAEQLARERERLDSLRSLVSHDLGNPVNIASGRVELARADEDTSHLDSVDGALEEIDALIERGVRLVEVGQQPLDRESLSIASIARDSWDDVGRDSGDLVVTDGRVDGERERVRMLLNELVRNAFAHSEGEITVDVGPLSESQGLYVADDGPGIPPDEREFVTDTGYTTDSAREGIGLSVVTEIAGAHGWDVSLEPREPSGTRVEIITSHW
ncbi:sensor histidine kinase [Halovenus salina]|uniref:histidine kinase n=1 Tax=Halovenus salina TaxID=1510225 RepID=A0ABD5W1N2_9EURY|nr:HAMP domain-containing sensor histidine kinase [Halovenus salina]